MADSAQYQSVSPKRKVWVLSRHQTKPYTEDYRGTPTTIPPNGEKDPAKNLFDLITAEKFLSKGAPLYEMGNDGVTELSMGKPLYIADLTIDERRKYDPRSLDEVQTDEGKFACTLCGDVLPTSKGLGLHVKRKHPDNIPIKEL